MVVLVRLFGIVIVAFGAIFLVSPAAVKKYMAFWAKRKRVYTGASLSVLFGIIFLLAASQCRLAWFVAIMGIWAIIKGIILFTLGPKKITSWMNWWTTKPPVTMRLIAIAALVMGILLIYAAA